MYPLDLQLGVPTLVILHIVIMLLIRMVILTLLVFLGKEDQWTISRQSIVPHSSPWLDLYPPMNNVKLRKLIGMMYVLEQLHMLL